MSIYRVMSTVLFSENRAAVMTHQMIFTEDSTAANTDGSQQRLSNNAQTMLKIAQLVMMHRLQSTKDSTAAATSRLLSTENSSAVTTYRLQSTKDSTAGATNRLLSTEDSTVMTTQRLTQRLVSTSWDV